MSSDILSLEKVLKHFYTEDYEIILYRFYALMIGFFLPIYGYVLLYTNPEATDFISHRVIIGVYWLIIAGLSYKLDPVKQYMTFFVHIGIYLFVLWILWIVAVNHFSFDYAIGLYLAYCSAGIVIRNRVGLSVYSFIMLALTSYAVMSCSIIGVHPGVYLLSMFTIALVYFIVLTSRGFVNQQLKMLNQTLEDKVTERTRLAEERAKALEEKNQELERFAYVASHDLKSPLRTIGNFTNLLAKRTHQYEDPSIIECNNFIANGVSRMQQTIDDLLNYSRVGKVGLHFKPININDLLMIVLNGLSTNINRSDVQVHQPVSFPEAVVCESRQIEQLFQNLIENAIKFNKKEMKTVALDFSESSDFWTFSVSDNGIGIPEERVKDIFEMFRRLHTYEEFPGTGIGLATCKRIVESHGGHIEVNSVQEQGTTFSFTISKALKEGSNVSIKEGSIKELAI